jgi:hypothetical protein
MKRLQVIRLYCERTVVAGQRLLGPFELQERIAAIVKCLCVVRLELEHAVIADDCFGKPLEGL